MEDLLTKLPANPDENEANVNDSVKPLSQVPLSKQLEEDAPHAADIEEIRQLVAPSSHDILIHNYQ